MGQTIWRGGAPAQRETTGQDTLDAALVAEVEGSRIRRERASEALRARSVADALAIRSPGHVWLKDESDAERAAADTAEAARQAADRAVDAHVAHLKAGEDRGALASRQRGLEREVASLTAAVQLGEAGETEQTRLAEVEQELAALDTGERRRLRDLGAALETRERSALGDFLPLHLDQLRADHNLSTLQVARHRKELAEVQNRLRAAENRVRLVSTNMKALEGMPGPDSPGFRVAMLRNKASEESGRQLPKVDLRTPEARRHAAMVAKAGELRRKRLAETSEDEHAPADGEPADTSIGGGDDGVNDPGAQ